MAVIPRSIYRTVEWHLHNVPRLLSEWQEDLAGSLPSGIPVISSGKGSHSDRTAGLALRLAEAKGKQATWQRWNDCISRAQQHFAGMVEGEMALRYYGANTTVMAVAEAMYVDKQTINRYRDRYVSYTALAAACAGLISMDGAMMRDG